MPRIDFSNYILPVPSVDEFGLVDPDDKNGKHPVFISLDRTQDRWGARVMYNKERRDYKFIPVDNNIPLKRDDGSDAPRCDCILETEKSVCFIELKNQRKGYLSKARDQIISTLGFFDNLTLFDKKLAYICNNTVICSSSTKTIMSENSSMSTESCSMSQQLSRNLISLPYRIFFCTNWAFL